MRNCRKYNQNHFFCLRFIFTIFYTESFQVPPEKNYPHLKCQFPPKILILPKSLLYKHSGKCLNPPITWGMGVLGGEGGWCPCSLLSLKPSEVPCSVILYLVKEQTTKHISNSWFFCKRITVCSRPTLRK